MPKPASTLILLRDGAQGLETLLLRRTQDAKAFGGAYVFPGGVVDIQDSADYWPEAARRFDDTQASRLLNLPHGGFAYWMAGLRECFEEAGILLAEQADGSCLSPEATASAHYTELRQRLHRGDMTFSDLLAQERLSPSLERVAYFSHWITPDTQPRRFDTRFFVARIDTEHTVSADGKETVEHHWLRPAEALAMHRDGTIKLVYPTVKTLEAIAGFHHAKDVLEHARRLREIRPMLPRKSRGREGLRILWPGDPAYAEVAHLDPEGHGTPACEIYPDVPVTLYPGLRRLTAPNAGFMTGPGTNTYLIGEGPEYAVVDPGPAHEAHLQAIMEETGGRIRWILVTHTHPDHSPGARILKTLTGAALLGAPAPECPPHDPTFVPDHILSHGERLTLAGRPIQVLHTPGHASNHFCYLMEPERVLLTGDHIMQGSTVVINPPDGNMTAYMASLESLRQLDLVHLAPGHGFLIERPGEALESLLKHRRLREAKTIGALCQHPEGIELERLVIDVYDDVPQRIHPLASRSLLAHLEKLAGEGFVAHHQGRWHATKVASE